MDESILTSVKKALGPEEDYEHFDPEQMCIRDRAFLLSARKTCPFMKREGNMRLLSSFML